MKRLCALALMMLCLVLAVLPQACRKEIEDDRPAGKIISVKGVEPAYSLGLHEYLEISPLIELSSEGRGVQYEWNINNKVVGREKSLKFKCSNAGNFGCYFKVSTPEGARIVQFKIYVKTAYNKGLLLLSDVDGETVLSFKRLDRMDSKPALYAFRDNNPKSSLGRIPLSVCWTGEGITNPRNIEDSGGLDVIISSSEPSKVYVLGADDFKIKNEIVYDGAGEFHPDKIISPYGWQNFAWVASSDKVLFFIGGGKEYLMNGQKNFLVPGEKRRIRDDVAIADFSCNLISRTTDFIKVYYDLIYKRMVYACYIGNTLYGKYGCDIDEPMNILSCDGEYTTAERYEPHNVLLVGRTGGSVKVMHFSPSSNKQTEALLKKIDATGHIGANSATGVNPVRPFLYYSDEKGNIYSLNYYSGLFSDNPYISLGENYIVRSIIFNPYDPDTMYVAAEDRNEQSSLRAAIFVYDVKKSSSGVKMFEGKNAGGKVRQLIYKGNGREYFERINYQI